MGLVRISEVKGSFQAKNGPVRGPRACGPRADLKKYSLKRAGRGG